MDSRFVLAILFCFLCFLPDLSVSSIRSLALGIDKTKHGSVIQLNRGSSSVKFDPTRVTQLSWRPRAFIYKKFLSDEECDHLINLAKDKLEKSMVADNESGKSVMSQVRTSSGMFLSKAQDEIVAGIEARIAAWTFLPIENGESIQILHYENGQKYEPHFDYFHDKANQQLGGHRIATVLMYLSNVEKGGETIFPNSEARLSQIKDDGWSECAKKGYAVKPDKGDALLFFSLHLDATTDNLSLHGSCPVIEGEKWSAPKFYPADDVKKPLVNKHKPKPTKLRASITPGTVLILLAGRFKGKRVVFLKQLPSGLLLVTGPFKINGVPLRRVCQSYVIGTSTKVDISGVNVEKFDDKYFSKKTEKKKEKTEGEFFEAEKEEKSVIPQEKKDDQKTVDSALLKAIESVPDLKAYLGARFSLKAGMKPHELVF